MVSDQGYTIVVLDEFEDNNPVRARLDQYPQMLYTQGNLETLSACPCIKGGFKDAVDNALRDVQAMNFEHGYTPDVPDSKSGFECG